MEQTVTFSPQQLTGRTRSHIVEVSGLGCSLHHAVAGPFQLLRAAAAVEGMDLLAVSSFRDFDRQLAIWNGKCTGSRPLRDRDGELLDATLMDEDALVEAILVWSALPGASRHHWGTDLDVIDAAAMPEGYRPQLMPAEFAGGGVFSRLDRWLSVHAAEHGFFRPYSVYRGGVQPEPWHLSHAAVAGQAQSQFSSEMLWQALEGIDLGARSAVQRRLPEIVTRYVLNVDAPPPAALTRATRLA